MTRNRIVTSTLVLLVCGSLVGWSQDAAKPTTKGAPAKEAAAEKKEDKKPVNRLPANYGKLGLTDAQRDKVYAINDKYEPQLDALEEQLKTLRAKRTSETEAVLTAEQKKVLKDITEDAKEKAATKAKAKTSDKDAADAPAKSDAKEKK
ncbi:MAG: hypothetical protein AABP62_22745 [Planctomycetota bacterium]